MKLSDAVRNHRASELHAAAGAASRPDGARSISDSGQFDEDLYSCNNLHDKNLHFVQSISCHKRHDLIIYKVYCCFACQMTKQHN
jgi:hypothetical protein